MRVSTSQLFNRTISEIGKQNAELDRLQKQIASGSKILTPSDNPADATRIVELDRAISRNEQFIRNGDYAFNRLSQSETTLEAVDQSLDRVQGLMFGNYGSTYSSRVQLARQLRDELSIITDLANTRDTNGDYLYAGHDVNTKPFTVNAAGNVVYTGDNGKRNIQIAENRRIPDSNSGDEIFVNTGAGRSVFAMIESVIAELENPAATTASVAAVVDTATVDLATEKDNLTFVRNSIASRIGMIQTEQEINKQVNNTLTDQKASLHDVDMTEAILKLNQFQTSLQAAQQAFAKTQQLSLFNYI